MKAQDNRHTSCTCVRSGQSQRSVLFKNRNLEAALVPREGSRPLLQPWSYNPKSTLALRGLTDK